MSMFPKHIGARASIAPRIVFTALGALAFASPVWAVSDATLRAFAAAERTRQPAPRMPRSAFLQKTTNTAVTLSPDGRHAAWLHETSRGREVWVRASDGGKPTRLLANTPAQRLHWSRDSRWLLLQSERELFALAMNEQDSSRIITTLGGRDKRDLVSVDASHPAAVIVLEQNAPTSWQLLRVDVHGKRTMLWQDPLRVVNATLDAHGQLAWLQRAEGLALVIHRVENGRLHAVKRCEQARRCSLLAAAPDGGVWLRGDLDGDLSQLQKLSANGDVQVVHSDPQETADIDNVVLDPYSRQPLFATYRSAAPVMYALNSRDAASLAAIGSALPGRDLSLQIGRGTNARWLIQEAASSLQGKRWHLFDPRTGALSPLFDDVPLGQRSGKQVRRIDEATTARMLSVSWRASDGMRLHGFLSLPPGRDPAQAPLVVNVHGGPWSHWAPEFRAVTQFLANRGYAVFEANFRASTGHGRNYVFAANGDFGNGRVQRDIVEGTRWLLANGIGDARRVGITGASFGGYSTLLGVTFQPELFKAGVAMVPPPDFGWVLRWISRNPEALEIGDVVPLREWLRLQALDIEDRSVMARLHAQSPLANVARQDRPLLAMAGGQDERVGLAGIVEYAARLKLANKDASLLIDDDAGHNNSEPLAIEAYLFALETMFHNHLGGAKPDAPDSEIRAYLRRGLRMAGSDFRMYAAPEVE